MSHSSRLPAEIEAYLASTRLALPWVDAPVPGTRSTPEMYGGMTGYIKEFAKSLGLPVHIEIVYSDAMRSEAITVDDRHFIIHDRYLGQVLNMMNRLYLYGASRRTKLIYFHKIVSQLLSRYGFYEESVFAARQYQESRDEMDHRERQRADGSNRHGFYAYAQELYILLHEFAHLYFKRDRALFSSLRDEAREWIEGHAAFASTFDMATLERATAHLRAEEREFLRENAERTIASQRLTAQFCQEMLRREDLVEEFCCDRYAILHLAWHLAAVGAASGKDAEFAVAERIKAIILCFLNFRTLQLLEAHCSHETEFRFQHRREWLDVSEGLYYTFYNARLHHAKDACYLWFGLQPEEKRAIHAVVTQMMDNHTDEMLEPARTVFSAVMYDKKLRTDMASEFEFIRASLDDDQRVKRVVSAILHYANFDEAERSPA